jgi:hypothetical protein
MTTPHPVFISHSPEDKPAADAVCAALEAAGLRCWVAPRDVLPGVDRGEATTAAIAGARVMVLVFSSHANDSTQVRREVERAADRKVPIVPFRIEAVEPAGAMASSIRTPHGLDAWTAPMDAHLDRLVQTVQSLLAGPVATEAPPVPPPARPTSATVARPYAPPRARTLLPTPPDRPGGGGARRMWVTLAAAVAVLLAAAGVGFWRVIHARDRPVTAGVTLADPAAAAPSTRPAATAPVVPLPPAGRPAGAATRAAVAPATGPTAPLTPSSATAPATAAPTTR